MTQLEVGNQAAHKLEKLSQKTGKTVDEILLWLLDNYEEIIVTDQRQVDEDDDVAWTEEELAELLKPKTGLTGKEIVEKHLASGVIGSWADMDITDSVEWLEAQKAKRRAKYQW